MKDAFYYRDYRKRNKEQIQKKQKERCAARRAKYQHLHLER